MPPAEALELFADQPYKCEIIERVTGGAADGTDATRDAAAATSISVYRNTPEFVDLCVGPHVPSHGPARSLQADEGGRRVLARQREGPDAAAHLRHGVGEQGGARRAPPSPGGGREARSPQAGHRARPAVVPARVGRRPGRVAPEGRHRAQAHGGLQPRPPRQRRLPVRVHAAPRQRQPVRDERSPRLVQGRHVPADGDGQRHVLHEADELPDALPHLPQPAAQLPRAAAAAVRAGHGVPLRAGRHVARPDAHPRLHAGRQPHLLHARSSCRTRSRRCSTSS